MIVDAINFIVVAATLAFASPPDSALELERARIALEEGRWVDARMDAKQAFDAGGGLEALRVYADASDGAGMGAPALAALEGEIPADAEVQRATRGSDVTELYRTRRRLLDKGDRYRVDRVNDALVRAGEVRPILDRKPWNEVMQRELGIALSGQKEPKLPTASPLEEEGIVTALAMKLEDQGRIDVAIGFLEDVRRRRDTVRLTTLEARLKLVKDEHALALELAVRAERLASLPADDDVGRLDTKRQAADLAAAFAIEAAAHAALHEGVAADRAMALAQALAPADWVRDTGAAPVVVSAGEAAAALHDPLVSAAVLALLTRDPVVRVRFAEELERMGAFDAAFVSYAVAGGGGAMVGDALARTWTGLGDWEPAAVAAVERFRAQMPAAGDIRGPVHLELGATAPDFSIETPAGTVRRSDLAGRVVVLTFWASWCGPCMVELPALQKLAGTLSAEGAPVTILAVSADERIQGYERVRRRPDLGALVFSWSPELAALFRVNGLPTTYVLDGEGKVKQFHTGFHAGDERALEREIRRVLAEHSGG